MAASRTAVLDPLVANERMEIRSGLEKGRGVFARHAIAPGTLIEAAPVIILPAGQCPLIDRTILHDYYFHWDGDPDGESRGVLALGLVTLCNHSRRPNARAQRNFAQQTLELLSVTPIGAGEEVTIDYNCPLWFEPLD